VPPSPQRVGDVLPFPQPRQPSVTEPDWRKVPQPKPVQIRPPKGAPNILLILLDDKTQGAVWSLAGETADVGMDAYSPVTDDYDPLGQQVHRADRKDYGEAQGPGRFRKPGAVVIARTGPALGPIALVR
jgi:hypothetical protein